MTKLTRRGWALAGGAIGLLVVGRLLAIPELYAVAVVALALIGGAVVYVRLWPWRIDAQREVHPPQVNAGGSSRVELSVRNMDMRPSPVLSARDPFDAGRRWARFHVAPVLPGEMVRAAYRLPTSERGIFPLGPLQIGLTDPFGLATRARVAAAVTTLTVYPRIDDIHPLSQARGDDPSGITGHPSLTAGGNDFYALRPYQTGDDLRRVHWPSTARTDELMIRQDELPWQGRVSVLADTRASVHNPASLELVLSAVASILYAGWRAGRQIRLLATDGTDTGLGAGHAHLATILEHLAAISVHPDTHLPAITGALNRGGASGAVAVVTTALASDEDLAVISRARSRAGSIAVVMIERSAWDRTDTGGVPPPLPRSVRYVRVSAERPFAAAWNEAVPRSQAGPGLGVLA